MLLGNLSIPPFSLVELLMPMCKQNPKNPMPDVQVTVHTYIHTYHLHILFRLNFGWRDFLVTLMKEGDGTSRENHTCAHGVCCPTNIDYETIIYHGPKYVFPACTLSQPPPPPLSYHCSNCINVTRKSLDLPSDIYPPQVNTAVFLPIICSITTFPVVGLLMAT